MRIFFAALSILFFMAGCGPADKGGQSLDRKIAKMESDMKILQQSVEMQSQQIKSLTGSVSDLKAQIENADLGAINELKGKVKNLQMDTSGFEK